MSDWRDHIRDEWNRRHSAPPDDSVFPLLNQGFDAREIVAVVETLLTGQLTMAGQVRTFEQRFAEAVGARHAVMVNSGSSANLLAFAAAANPARKHHLKKGDEVLVPAVCWSTSLWPIVQNGLTPVLVDVDPMTLNVSLLDLRQRITSRARAIMNVHVLGNSPPMDELTSVAREHGLLLIEDTCESLGSRANGRWLGTIGDFGTYSFYYSHHITTGEGGVVVCQSDDDYDLLKCLRGQGWSRELSNRAPVEAEYADIDPRFLFINAGFNLRPLEVQAAFGICQLERLGTMNATRNENRARLIAAMQQHPQWTGQYRFSVASAGTDPAWFGLTLLINTGRRRAEVLANLTKNGVENRPVISGNFARQPALRLFGIDAKPRDYPGAEEIHERGFFIGIHTRNLPDAVIERVAATLIDAA